MTPVSFTAIGDVGVDIYPDKKLRLPGGTALNSAVHAARAGARASIISSVGDDADGMMLLQYLQGQTVDTTYLEIHKGKTDSVEIILDTDARPQYRRWELGVLKDFTLNRTHESFLRTRHIAISVHLPPLAHLFNAFADMDLPHTMKVGDFTDLSECAGDQSLLRDYRDRFDVFALSIDERVTQRLEIFRAFVEDNHKLGIALLGAKGSRVYFEEKEYKQSAHAVSLVDTTGAGDTYLSYFLVDFFQKKDIAAAMNRASIKATETITHVGAG